MAGLILCRNEYATKPYSIRNVGIHIYSIEELCYYIYNNIYLIGTDLIEDELISYIRKELKEEELASQLEFLVEQKAGLSELVITILRYVDYYSDTEINELKNLIDKLDTQNVSERLKARADNFLSNKRYYGAICNYELIVYGKMDKTLPIEFYGNVWHNMGVAHSRMYAFEEAGICFKTAFELNHKEESQKAYIAALGLEYGLDELDDEDEIKYVTHREIETLMDHAIEENEYTLVKDAFDLKKQGKISEYYQAVNFLIEKWKIEYRNYIK